MDVRACYAVARVNTKRTWSLIAALIVATLVIACAAPGAPPDVRRPVIVQGAMDVEIEKLARSLAQVTEEKIGGWTFWRGTLDGYPVIASKTLKGMENA